MTGDFVVPECYRNMVDRSSDAGAKGSHAKEEIFTDSALTQSGWFDLYLLEVRFLDGSK